MPFMTFEDAIANSQQFSKRHLLLGNGFSIACRADIFHYGSLFDQADFSAVPEVAAVFQALATQDFEAAIRALENAVKILPTYLAHEAAAVSKMQEHATKLKEILVQTIAGNHPNIPSDIPDEKFWACRRFLAHFLATGGQVFTLNYDLLLYWTLMHDDSPDERPIPLKRNDGFGNDEDDPEAEYVVWQGETGAHDAKIHYLHGALHLFDSGAELKKYTWVRTNVPLVSQARLAISMDAYPLFVAEGTSAKKKAKIRHSAYLYQGFKQFTANVQTGTPCFFIFGHSLAENDEHILNRIAKGRFPKLYVGIYGNPETPENQFIIRRANALAAPREVRYPLSVDFYDASSAQVWG